LYTAAFAERSATSLALPVLAFQAEMTPSSPAKMNSAFPAPGITKSVVGL